LACRYWAGRVALRENRARQHRLAGSKGSEAARPKINLLKSRRSAHAASPADFGKVVADDTEKWGTMIRAANIKVRRDRFSKNFGAFRRGRGGMLSGFGKVKAGRAESPSGTQLRGLSIGFALHRWWPDPAQATTGMRGVSLPDRAEKDCVTASPVARVVPRCTVNGRLRARSSAQEMALERAHTSKNTGLVP